MRQRDVIKLLEQHGFRFLRPGRGSHLIYTNGIKQVVIPREVDRNPYLVKAIFKQAGLKL
jgi:predicted RNA binding protein YcfA (HicA-like mRNA interferase family)